MGLAISEAGAAAILPFFSKREATGEGGLITGTNPVTFTASDPLRLWIVQVGIIIIMAQLLSLGLRRLRQPRVIAEVLGGILLGPTAFGRIPGFTERIFPPVSLPYLSLVANIGLCLFLFIVGLEIDASIIKRNARMSILVSLTGIAVPFGLGSALSVPLYHHFIGSSVHFTYFMLFTGVAYSITAFPVLCRILTELKLLDTHIGIIALSAGVGNDIIGWTLLALSVALVNAGSGLTALWILLVCIGFAIFLLIPVKFVMRWAAHKTGSVENGPTMFYMTVVIILVWASAFFTDAIGVNAIFGAFLAGLAIPREGGLAITLTEKLEDMVSIVFLPLYFTLSGLNTNLGLLNDGITWAFTIAIICLSFFGKFGGCTFASRIAGYSWRESSTIGALMSCKGLVELIVLNVGLQAGILSQKVFSMFVLEALVLTFMTTPVVTVLYPPERRLRAGATALPPLSLEDGDEKAPVDEKASILMEEHPWRHRFTVVLDKLDHVPGAMALTQLILPPRSTQSDAVSGTTALVMSDGPRMPYVSVEALQLTELSERTSAMMKSVADSTTHADPMLGIFRTFGELNELSVTTSVSVVPHDDFARSVAEHAQKHGSHLVLLPWLPTIAPANVDAPDAGGSTLKVHKVDHNPFDVLFGTGPKTDKSASVMHSQFVQNVFTQSKTDVALFIDPGDRSGVRVGGLVHVFLPFFGGPDDRLALEFVAQLCLNPRMTATVVRMVKRERIMDDGASLGEEVLPRLPMAYFPDRPDSPRADGHSVVSTIAYADTVYSGPTTQVRLQSEMADHIAWARYAMPSDAAPELRQALSRIRFSDAQTSAPVHAAIQHARALRESSPRLLVVTGRSRRLATEGHRAEMKRVLEACRSGGGVGSACLEGMRKTIGDMAAAMTVTMGTGVGVGVGGGPASAMVVVQAAPAT